MGIVYPFLRLLTRCFGKMAKAVLCERRGWALFCKVSAPGPARERHRFGAQNAPHIFFCLGKRQGELPEGQERGPWGQTCRARYKRKPPFARLLVRPEQMGLGSSSCAGPVELSLRSRRSCFVGCKPEGAKRTRGSFCAAAARPGIRRRFLPAGSYTFFFCPLSGSGAVAQSSPICTNDSA